MAEPNITKGTRPDGSTWVIDVDFGSDVRINAHGGIAGHHPDQEGGPIHERPRRVEAAGP